MKPPIRKPMRTDAPRPPSTSDFESALLEMLAAAGAEGESFLDVTADALSDRVSGRGERARAHGVCCSLMRRMMIPGDHEISLGVRASSTSLFIRYRLPR